MPETVPVKFFADTAEIADIRELAATGLLDGVTTNPSLIAKSGRDGLKTCKALTGEGTMVNVTLCFSANQALLAAKAGATFISPFVGRHDDNGWDGMDLIRDIRLIYDNYAFATEILVASVRHSVHVLEAARIGADVMTAPPSVIKGLFKHVLTDKGIEGFLADWAKTGQSL
jgi:transaldolase